LELSSSFIMQCAPSEQRSLSILTDVFPDICQILGPNCADILQQHRKIELEAIVSAKQSASLILRAARHSEN